MSLQKFSNILSILNLIALSCSLIEVVEPPMLKDLITNKEETPGLMDYSVSLFGFIDYLKEEKIEIILPETDNQFGCTSLSNPKLHSKTKFAFILKRGVCPFYKKAMNAKLVRLKDWSKLYIFLFRKRY